MTDLEYLKEAYLEAARGSTDPSTQNGAVITERNTGNVLERDLSLVKGANHFPFGVHESPERWERPAKYNYVEHAERNAIFNAARNGISTMGSKMYCPWFACVDCARAIIQAGIREVVGHDCELHNDASQSWKESVAIGDKMLDESGVLRRYVKGKVGIYIRFNGNVVEV